jgi:glycosyltransferase involved in cell wall biosynthesis
MISDERINVLVISYHFAPSTKVGAKRFGYLSRLFQEKYFNTHVLTVDDAYLSERDESVPYGGTIHRSKVFPLHENVFKRNILTKIFYHFWLRYFAVLDPYCGMIFPGLIKGLRIIKRNEIDVIIASGPPFSPFVLASILSSITGTKLILDYRDPWSNSESRYAHSWFSRVVIRGVNMLFERAVVARASAAVFATGLMKEHFLARFGAHTRADIYVITNGFEKLETVEPLFLEESRKTILYAGSLVYERNIALLAECVQGLTRRGMIRENSVAIHIFASTVNTKNKEAIEKMGRLLIVHEPVEYKTVLRYMKGADILYLTSSAEVLYAIPYKFYDYINMKRPIFAVAPQCSALARVMSEVHCGELAALEDEEAGEKILLKMLTEQNTYDFSGSEKYSWDAVASTYAGAIREILRGEHIPQL